MPKYSEKFINKLREVYTNFYAEYDQPGASERIEEIIRYFTKNITIMNVTTPEITFKQALLSASVWTFLPAQKFSKDDLCRSSESKFPSEDINALIEIYSEVEEEDIETNALAIAIFKETKFYDEGFKVEIIKQIVKDSGLRLKDLYYFIYDNGEPDAFKRNTELILNNPKLLDLLDFYQFKCEKYIHYYFYYELYKNNRDMIFPRFSECSDAVQQTLLRKCCINKSPEERCQTYMDAVIKRHRMCCVRINDMAGNATPEGDDEIIMAAKLNHHDCIRVEKSNATDLYCQEQENKEYPVQAFFTAIQNNSIDTFKFLCGYYYEWYDDKFTYSGGRRNLFPYGSSTSMCTEKLSLLGLCIALNRLEILLIILERYIIDLAYIGATDPHEITYLVDLFNETNLDAFKIIATPQFMTYHFAQPLIIKILLNDFIECFKLLGDGGFLTDVFCANIMASCRQNPAEAPKKIFEFLTLSGY
jgi:hypothetical protein